MNRNTLTIFILFYGFFMMQSNIMIVAPILNFIQADLDIPNHVLGYVLAAFPIVATASNIVLGPYLDKYGQKRMILIGSVLCAFFFALTAMSSNATTMIFCRIAIALCMPMVGASILPYVANHFPAKERLKIMGYVLSATYVATIISIPLGILGSGYLSWRYVFVALAIISVSLFILVKVYLPSTPVKLNEGKIGLHTYKSKFFSFASNKNITFNLSAKFFQVAGNFVFAGFYPLWLYSNFSSLNIIYTDIALLFLACGIAGWVGSNLSGKLSALFKSKTSLYAWLAVLSGLFTLITPMISLEQYYYQFLVYIPVIYFQALFSPIILTMLMQSAKPSDRGSVNGINNAVFQMGTAFGVMLGSFLYLLDDSLLLNAIAGALFLVVSGVVFKIFVEEDNPAS